jgi:2-dehydropantoate 2-reductase
MKTNDEKIFIIGSGAIGKTLAAFLKQTGKDVVLLRGHINDQVPQLETIIIELNDGKTVRSDVTVSAVNNYPTLNGIIVLATKSYGNHQIAESLKGKTADTPIVVMQNGLDVENSFIDNAFQEIYRCVLFTSCQFTENNVLRFKPASDSPIGVVKGSEERLTTIVEILNNPYLIFKAEKNIQPIIWTKAIINSVFNSVCPLLETDNGIFQRNERVRDIAKAIILECIAIASTEGIDLDADKVLERLLLISKSSDGQLISTYQDLLHKRKTEIETLNLAIARKAEKINSSSLVKMTGILGELVDIKSQLLRSVDSLHKH